MIPIKVFGIFFSIIFLLSCTITPKKIDKDLAIQRIDIYPINSTDTFEEIIILYEFLLKKYFEEGKEIDTNYNRKC